MADGVDDTQDEDGGAHIEGPLHAVGHNALGSHIGNTDGGEQEREDVAHQRACIAQERLDRVGFGLLFLVDHVAHHHLEGLHGHVDARVKEHEGNQAEGHGAGNGQAERAGIGQQAHHDDGCQGTNQQIGDAAAPAAHPRLVAEVAHQRLHHHAHERRQNPEITQVVRVGAQGREDAADVCALQCIGDLHPKETKTDVPQLVEFQIRFSLHHSCYIFSVK